MQWRSRTSMCNLHEPSDHPVRNSRTKSWEADGRVGFGWQNGEMLFQELETREEGKNDRVQLAPHPQLCFHGRGRQWQGRCATRLVAFDLPALDRVFGTLGAARLV